MAPNHEGHDATEGTDFSITSLVTDSRRRPLEARTLVNLISILLVVALIIGTAPWWSGVALSLWHRVFPPPAYTGALVFEDGLATLTAHAATDGHPVWHLANIPQNSGFYRDGATLYVLPNGQQRLIALRVSDGHQRWTQPLSAANISGNDILTFVGSSPTILYIKVFFTAYETTSLLNIDKQTGNLLSEMAGICYAVPAPPTLILADCREGEREHTVTSDGGDGDSRQLQVLSGRGIRAIVRDNYIIDVAVVPGVELRFTALDLRTGAIVWQANTVTGIPYFGATVIIIESNPQDGSASTDTYIALDAATGAHLWSLTRTGENASIFFLTTAHTDVDTFTLNEQTLIATDERTGVTRWTLPTAAAAAAFETWRAEFDNETLYFADRDQLLAVDAVTGKVRWHLDDGGHVPTSLALGGGNLYEITGGHLLARDPHTSKVRWQQAVASSADMCAACNSTAGT
ncbi:MAG: PQQ-binding-like beta-propeller repeat protein [Ktedonobacterales bacterium]|nr:PQQ-binding-like beta-propeller repeat protein [Ktedonobacterales bacterium]